MFAPLTLVFALLATRAVAQQAAQWGQCGGQNWNGAKSCQSGLECRYQNDYYSQCLGENDNPAWAQEQDEAEEEGEYDEGDEGGDEGGDEDSEE